MTLPDIIFLAVGLAMDCLSVSIVQGIRSNGDEFRLTPMVVLMVIAFGLFQGAMPLIGFYVGGVVEQFVNRYAGWMALGVLGFIGGKMIRDSFYEDTSAPRLNVFQVFLLAVATSIDAAVSGILFVPVPNLLWKALAIIAVTSSLLSLVGYVTGHFLGRLLFNAERVGGIILILIGLKICFLS